MDAGAITTPPRPQATLPLGTVDGRVLPRQLVDVFDRGEQAKVPILAGFNSGEIRSLRFLLPPAPADAAAYEKEIRARYRDLADAFLTPLSLEQRARRACSPRRATRCMAGPPSGW